MDRKALSAVHSMAGRTGTSSSAARRTCISSNDFDDTALDIMSSSAQFEIIRSLGVDRKCKILWKEQIWSLGL